MAPANDSDTFDIGGDATVHRMGYGAMRITGPDIVGAPDDEDAARDVVRRAVELGVDFVDTADSYGPGASERLLREALGENDDVFVATKAGLLRTRDGDWLPHGEPDFLENQALCSLDRLGVDSIDLLQLHSPDPDTPFEDSVHRLAELKDAGLVDHVGLSNVSVDQLESARDIVDVATVQNEYNVANRDHEDVLSACEDYEIGFIPYFPIGGGDLGEQREPLEAVADDHDATVRQVALAWLLDHSPVTLPIPGTSSIDHLESNVAATQLSLTDDNRDRLA
ncbi:aldo/keto reductase [Halobacterium jilantaiense]|uniref:Predicted oxidoreductase n=1 Tax=Halobacterium jilantaiense TaxID=355548 RepID=A0A1I0P9R6_9EURY|nr:aldo/keto reductase [Halobacterium jilantaiense]SEW10823.1 Predicted oxidoreductase [Halobacterium jilantaiense]